MHSATRARRSSARRAAAQLEASKDFAKSFMARHRIPTAAHRTFDSVEAAKAYVAERGAPIVVKADGLAAGKGVVVAASVPEAHAAIERMMTDRSLGSAATRWWSRISSRARKRASSS